MFRNYITVAVRNLLRHKAYSLINISGLAIGMACCILILLYVQDELSYDRYHENAGRIYRLALEAQIPGKVLKAPVTPGPMGPAFANDYPEVISAVRFYRDPWHNPLVSHGDKRFYQERFFFADSNVFDMFTFPLIRGNPKTALREPNSIVITEEMAEKYFGNEDPMGKVLAVELRHMLADFRVTGILRRIPHNSHFRFDCLAPIANVSDLWRDIFDNWGNYLVCTYLLLRKDPRPALLEEQFPSFMNTHMKDEQMSITLHLQPLTRIHLHSHLEYEIEPNSDIAYIYVFSAIAFFILVIACINFINLSTARSTNRAKEVGMRKAVGAHRLQLIRQFLGESVFLSLIALMLAIALVELALPALNALAGKELAMGYGGNLPVLLGLVGIALFVGIVSGTYPAFFLSAFQLADVLKGTLKAGSKNPLLRRVLVVLQFAISIILIIGTGVVYNQLDYIRDKRLGFHKEHVIVLPIRGQEVRQNYEAIRSKLLQDPDILGVAASSRVPGGIIGKCSISPEGAQNEFVVPWLSVDHDFIETLGIELAAGRDFSKDFATDAAEAIMLNEAAVKRFGWESPHKAIGKKARFWGKKRAVTGVVKDFHISSLHHSIEPLVLHVHPNDFLYISARIRSDHISDALDFLKHTWHEFAPNHPFEYFFLDDSFDKLYRAEHKLGRIFGSFSLLAISIACLGLFGLASFATEQRTKEIGIRKVLGASVSGIVLLLSKEFTKLVIVSNLIAWPIAYFAMKDWLENFAYHIHIGVGTFVLGGILALIIALLTVSFQAIKAALANPVDALRYE